VSHAGAELLRELAGATGLIGLWDRALNDTYRAMPAMKHFPGPVLVDLAVAVADGAKIDLGSGRFADSPGLFGPVASTSTAWRSGRPVLQNHGVAP
jgi:hypothetical protein